MLYIRSYILRLTCMIGQLGTTPLTNSQRTLSKSFGRKLLFRPIRPLLTRLQQLESENARLKGQASGSSRPAPKTSQAGAKTSQRKGGPKQVVVPVSTPPPEDAPEEGSQEDARIFRTFSHHRMRSSSQTQDRLQPMTHTNSTFRSPVSHCFLKVAVWTVTLYEG